jgi:hypothetical protein
MRFVGRRVSPWGSVPCAETGKRGAGRRGFAHYQPILRFLLIDPERRLFVPERYCFRGSVDDWISIGPPDTIRKLAARYLKHLGQDSFFELY